MAQVTTKGIGPFYWCKEYEAEGRVLDTAWMRETDAPHRAGKALRIRVGTRALHLGLCRKTKPFARDVEVDPEEIRSWL